VWKSAAEETVMRQTTACLIATVLIAYTSPLIAAPAACEKASTGAALIELYTSEGCNSCPPTDRWLNAIKPSATQVPIAFHVDYWAYLGWPDRLTLEGNTALHSQRARAAGVGVYTPGLFHNGKPIRSTAALASNTVAATPWQLRWSFTAATRTVQALAFERDADCASASCERVLPAQFAIVEDGLSTEVKAGENRGVTLQHDHVARKTWASSDPQSLPTAINLQHARLIAWREDHGRATDAISAPLNCESSAH
jgi:hypothetical protein